MEEFLAALPRRVFETLSAVSVRDPAVRGLVDHVLRQRAESRATGVQPATPGELHRDMMTLLASLDEQARTGRLPPYLPAGADVTALSRTVSVRPEVRRGLAERPAGEGGWQMGGSRYRLPVERPQDSEPPRSWPQVAGEYRRLVVLADPGLGKSWLVRTETHRLCTEALAILLGGPAPVVIPVPVRCDQLVTAAGHDLADKAAAHLVAQGLLAERSSAAVAAQVRAGEAVVLLDALDELTEAKSGPLRDLVRSWADQASDNARCVITSRIAGYTGSPLPGAREVELQAFTAEEVVAAIEAWRLPPEAASQLWARLQNPATRAMARIPLLLALLCSLALQALDGASLPATRGQLYERVLRWFLTRAHRSLDDPGAPALDDVQVDALLQILAPMAYTFATQPAGWTDLMPGDSLLNAIRTAGDAFTELHRPAAHVLRELSVGAGVLVPEGDPSAGRSPRYLFLHRTVAEYLTARHLATLPQADWLAVVEQHRWFDPDWAEVIPMLGERLSPDSARALIQHLLAGECDPFHWSLRTAALVWGARPDADHLLAPGQLNELAGRLDDLLRHQHTGYAAVAAYSGMTYLPHSVLTGLLAGLTDPDSYVRASAAQALDRRQDPEVTEALRARLDDPDLLVMIAATLSLGRQESPEATEALLVLLSDPDSSVRFEAARALEDREGPEVTAALRAGLDDPDSSVRSAAVTALGGREGPEVTEALLARLDDPDSSVRSAAMTALGGREGPEVTEALLARLDDPDSSVRSAAVTALGAREGPEVTEALLALLSDPDSSVRFDAAIALGGREGPGVTEALLALSGPDSSVRFDAAIALGGREGLEVTEALLALLSDPAEKARRSAAIALGAREGPEVTEALLVLLSDPDSSVRSAAATALGGREGPEVAEALLAGLSDPDEEARRLAARTLAGSASPEALLTLARTVQTLNQPSLLRAYDAAGPLMIRHYHQIDPADQPEVLATMGWLTTAALTDDSA